MIKKCQYCGKEFSIKYDPKGRERKFCSPVCYFKSKKGKASWNKGTKGVMKAWNKGIKTSQSTIDKLSLSHKGKHVSPDTEFKKGNTGRKCPTFKHGLSKTKAYKAFVQKRRQIRKMGNGGSHSMGEWENLKAQYNWTCPCCGRSEPDVKLTEDHIIPLTKGGSDNIENIQPLCQSCNSKKHTKIIKFNYIQR